ncbi:MAG: hypothetical protein EBX52_11430 [Proteobacteria bacterium]|nr:hypothetical protein [Pseudomonadota bacterium]
MPRRKKRWVRRPAATLKTSEGNATPDQGGTNTDQGATNQDQGGAAQSDASVAKEETLSVFGKTGMKNNKLTSNGTARVSDTAKALKAFIAAKDAAVTLQSIKVTCSTKLDNSTALNQITSDVNNALAEIDPTPTVVAGTKGATSSGIAIDVSLKGPAEKVAKAKSDLETALKAALPD